MSETTTAIDRFDIDLDRLQRRALLVGAGAIVTCALLAFIPGVAAQFFYSYLAAFLLWTGITLGSIGIVSLHHLVGGRWGYVIRRPLEAGASMIPVMAVLFLPLLLGVTTIYAWSDRDWAKANLGSHKLAYYTVTWWAVRAAIYFAIWYVLATVLNRMSLHQDRDASPHVTRRLRLFSGPAIVIYVVTMTLASYDWMMSITPNWYSTIYGFLVVAGQALSAFAFFIACLVVLSRRAPLSNIVNPGHFHDLGNLMMALVMVWSYMSFSQYLIIWSGNIPEEVHWYHDRLHTGWRYLAGFLIVFHFAVPFALLLARPVKRNPRAIVWVALGVIVMRLMDIIWLTQPALVGAKFWGRLFDVALAVGIGGIWISMFLRKLKARPILPVNAPEAADESAEAHHHPEGAHP